MARIDLRTMAMDSPVSPYGTIIVPSGSGTFIVLMPNGTIIVLNQGSTIIVPSRTAWRDGTIIVPSVLGANVVLLSVSVLFCSSSLIYKEKLLLQSLYPIHGYTISGPLTGPLIAYFRWSPGDHSTFSYNESPFHRFFSDVPLWDSLIQSILISLFIGFTNIPIGVPDNDN